jgi:hypothetical protein
VLHSLFITTNKFLKACLFSHPTKRKNHMLPMPCRSAMNSRENRFHGAEEKIGTPLA